ncbi:hypothetical protein [Gramella sp. KN1008]|uniref:hypothetical protein n=1 Tax=Gramella sp. KN1008 TaxID=2529298 RepID=UPI001038EF87|nr:hypothetical protein [Gramella sp. KN1008]TBW28240.1 hypothetical protein EZJ28_05705 [Gramella sp. KN1008]
MDTLNLREEKIAEGISIRLGIEDDIDQILALQNYWLAKSEDNKNGFLFGARYKTSELKRIIENNNLILAKVKNEFAGFFLVDADSGNELTKAYQVQLKRNLPDFSKNSCPRAQIAMKLRCLRDFQITHK